MIKICIIHFNTQRLTECLLMSIMKYTPNSHIYLFDNSDKTPFKNSFGFENITYYDNTKGQIINFDKWLKNYPNRFESGGKTNSFGSAKHCFSVEKCIELIDDNFILLDSDVLLKKDISELYDNKFLYVAETETQYNSNIKRVLPFICFINVKKCKEKGIHYFYEDKMHGLRLTKQSDMYDTGAGFYYNANMFPHKDIKCTDYIEHFKGGSWGGTKRDKIAKNGIGEKEWLLTLKHLWYTPNKKVVYTCITGGYDKLIEPSVITNGFDYVCFTDNKKLKSNTWQIKELPNDIKKLVTTDVKKQRAIKILPHKYLSEYDLSIWVDGNVQIKGDLNEFLEKECTSRSDIFIPQHPIRNCIYDEARECVRLKKDTKENIEPQIRHYQDEHLPLKNGMVQSNIIVRKHNSASCVNLMEQWWNEVYLWSHRDQLSFNYVLWKNKDVSIVLLPKLIYNSKYFFWGKHSKDKSFNKTDENITITQETIDLNEKSAVIINKNKQKKVKIKKYIMVDNHKKLIKPRKFNIMTNPKWNV